MLIMSWDPQIDSVKWVSPGWWRWVGEWVRTRVCVVQGGQPRTKLLTFGAPEGIRKLKYFCEQKQHPCVRHHTQKVEKMPK